MLPFTGATVSAVKMAFSPVEAVICMGQPKGAFATKQGLSDLRRTNRQSK